MGVQGPPKVVYSEWIKCDQFYDIVYAICCFFTFGIVYIVHLYYPVEGKRAKSLSCDPKIADFIIVKFSDSEPKVVSVEHFDLGSEQICSFEVDGQRYCASSLDFWTIYAIRDVPYNFKRFLRHPPHYDLHLRKKEKQVLHSQYGSNEMAISIPSLFDIIVKHASHPVICFGYFATIIWFVQLYYGWALLVLLGVIMAVFAMTQSSWENVKRLSGLANHEGTVYVVDPYGHKGEVLGPVTCVPDSELIVGDRFLLPVGLTLPCDSVLISGRVIMDESMLTGESIPVTKSPIELAGLGGEEYGDPLLTASVPIDRTSSEHNYTPEIDIAEKRPGSVLFGGTKVVHSVGDAVCVCYRTGFRSAKGQLVMTLLNPREDFLNFFEDLLYVLFFMFVLASVLFIYECFYLVSIGASVYLIIMAYFDILTKAIPIGLAVCLVVSTFVSTYRLKLQDIYVSDSYRLNIAGLVTVACFDKTGTLTEEQLEFQGAKMTTGVLLDDVQWLDTVAGRHLREGLESTNLAEVAQNDYAPYSAKGPQCETIAWNEDKHFTSTNRLVDVGFRAAGNYANNVREARETIEGREWLGHSMTDASSCCESLPSLCVEVMATCHSLSVLSEGTQPVGDLLEVELFRVTGWRLKYRASDNSRACVMSAYPPDFPSPLSSSSRSSSQPSSSSSPSPPLLPSQLQSLSPSPSPSSSCVGIIQRGYDILRHFEFSPDRPRSATLLQRPTGELVYLLKGSPELLLEICEPSSIPTNIHSVLGNLAKRGLRILAFAHRRCGESVAVLSSMPQDEIEKLGAIKFSGFLLLNSRLKASAKETVSALQAADVQVNMITGDHVDTAIAVAVACGIVPRSVNQSRLRLNHGFGGRERKNRSKPIVSMLSSATITTDAGVLFESVEGRDPEGISPGEEEPGLGDMDGEEVQDEGGRDRVTVKIDGLESFCRHFVVDEDDKTGCPVVIDCQTSSVVEMSPIDLLLMAMKDGTAVDGSSKAGSSTASTTGSKEIDVLEDTDQCTYGCDEGDGLLSSSSLREPANETDEFKWANYKDSTSAKKNSRHSFCGDSNRSMQKDHNIDLPVYVAVTGKGLASVRRHYPDFVVVSLVRFARIFARTKPQDKKFIVETIMQSPSFLTNGAATKSVSSGWFSSPPDHCDTLWETCSTGAPYGREAGDEAAEVDFNAAEYGEDDEVLFCGDGANDMSALRAATVGLSLCDVETSIAAPATSKKPIPLSAVALLLEGRCSIATTYSLVQFNVLHAGIMLFMVAFLYGYGILVSDSMLVVQGLYMFFFGGVIIMIPSTNKLGIELPPRRYFSSQLMVVMIPQFILFPLVQVLALWILSQQAFYSRFTTSQPLTSAYSYEGTTLQNIVLAQFLIAAVVSTIGHPFKEEWYTSPLHVGLILLGTTWLLYQTFAGSTYFAEVILTLEPVPTYFGYYLVALYVGNAILSGILWGVSCRVLSVARRRRKLPIVLRKTNRQT